MARRPDRGERSLFQGSWIKGNDGRIPDAASSGTVSQTNIEAMMARWFRHYPGAVRDPKFLSVAMRTKQPLERVTFVWWAILEDAAERNAGGAFQFDCNDLAYLLRIPSEEIDRIYSGLEAVGVIGESKVSKWKTRQFEDDTSAERTRRYRERKRQSGGAHVTSQDVTVTRPESDTESDSEAASLGNPSTNESAAFTDQEILDALLKAIGKNGDVPPAMRDVGPIAELLREGFDLDHDVLPVLRSKRDAGKASKAKSWSYFDQAIREKGRRPDVLVCVSQAIGWISSEDPRWGRLSARWITERKHPSTPRDKNNGWSFPLDWIEAIK